MELMAVHQVLNNKTDCLIVLPFGTRVREMCKHLQPIAEREGFVVKEYAGSKYQIPVKKQKTMRTIHVATFELAHAVIDSLMSQERLKELGLVQVHSLHLIGDKARGPKLETLVSKILQLMPTTRLIGHTIKLNESSMRQMAEFLGAHVLVTDAEAVVGLSVKTWILKRNQLLDATSVVAGTGTYDAMPVLVPELVPGQESPSMCRPLKVLVSQTVTANKTCIVFSPTIRQCETIAKNLSSNLNENETPERQALADEMTGSPDLQEMVKKGIAFHHNELSEGTRLLIQNAFRDKVLSVVVSTSAFFLSVNIPADRVILFPHVSLDFVDRQQLHAMSTRAKDEVIIIWEQSLDERIRNLLENLPSCRGLLLEKDEMPLFVLTMFSYELATSEETMVQVVMNYTLTGRQNDPEEVRQAVQEAIKYLRIKNLMEETEEEELRTTSLGNGVARSLLSVDDGIELNELLVRGAGVLRPLKLMHLIASFMSFQDLTVNVIEEHIISLFHGLTPEEQESATDIGLNPENEETLILSWRLHHISIGYALILLHLISGRPESDALLEEMGIRGERKTKLQKAARKKGRAISRFLQETEFPADFLITCNDACARLSFIGDYDLLQLMNLRHVDKVLGQRMRVSRYRTVAQVANAVAGELAAELLIQQSVAEEIISSARHEVRVKSDEDQD